MTTIAPNHLISYTNFSTEISKDAQETIDLRIRRIEEFTTACTRFHPPANPQTVKYRIQNKAQGHYLIKLMPDPCRLDVFYYFTPVFGDPLAQLCGQYFTPVSAPHAQPEPLRLRTLDPSKATESSTQTLPLPPTTRDVGQNYNETRSGGTQIGPNDFSHFNSFREPTPVQSTAGEVNVDQLLIPEFDT